jgi:L-amino acid N-acyltransferase YncA
VQHTTLVRAATARDAAPIAAIYNHYIAESIATFEESTVTEAEMTARIARVQSSALPWLVAESGERVIGYAYAAPWMSRSAYRFSAEITVYLDPRCVGNGIGSALYGRLLPILGTRRIHSVIGGIALPNDASVALHEKFDMRKVAHFEAVGFKFGHWIDVGYWQQTL